MHPTKNRSAQSLPSAPSPNLTFYRWAIVGMLWFICFFNYADRVAISSVLPILHTRYGFNKTELGMIGSAFTWVYSAMAPVAGHVGDRYPRKWVILGGLYLWSLITGLTGLCARLWQFLLVRGSEGMGETFYIPASMALISDYHTPATRSRAIGLHQTSIYAGTIFGSSLAGWMALHYGWQSPFVCLGLAGIVLGILLSRYIREPKRNEAERALLGVNAEADAPSGSAWAFALEFARTPTAMLLIAAFFGANLVAFVFLTWMPTFLHEKFNLDLAKAGLGATFFIQLASMAGATFGGVVADHRIRRCAVGRIQVQAAGILLGTPFIFLCGYTRSTLGLIVAMTLFGLGKGIYDSNLTAAFYDVVRPARRSTATGLMNFLGWTGAGIGPLAIGYAVDHGVTMSAAISSTALIYLVVALLLLAAAAFTAPNDLRTVK